MSVCSTPGCQEHYGCRLKAKGIRTSTSLESTRTLNMVPTTVEGPVQNRQIMTVSRPGGYEMPILKPNGDPVRFKEFHEKRATIDDHLHRVHQATSHA